MVEAIHGDGATPEAFAGELWLESSEGEFVISVPRGGTCPFLSERRCTIHRIRPSQCRTYPFWPEVLESRGSWEAERRYCEGISDDGEHYDLIAIARVMNGDATGLG